MDLYVNQLDFHVYTRPQQHKLQTLYQHHTFLFFLVTIILGKNCLLVFIIIIENLYYHLYCLLQKEESFGD
jgi:hypothetical protein